VLGCCVVFGVTLISGLVTIPTTPLGGDEAALLLYGERVGGGDLPNQDFFTVYGPGSYRLLSALFNVTGPSVWTERGLGIMYHLAITVGVMIAAYSFGRRASLVAGSSSCVLLLWFTPAAYAWLGGLALIIWSIALLTLKPARPWAWAVAGVASGLVSSWRLEMLVLAVATLPLIWGRRRLMRTYVCGFVVGLVPTVLHLWSAALPTGRNVFAERLGINAQSVLAHVDLHVWLLLLGCLLAPLALLLRARIKSEQRRVAIALMLLCVLALPQALQRIDIFHALFVSCLAVPVLLAIVATSSDRHLSVSRGVQRVAAVIAVAGVGLGSLALAATQRLPTVDNSGRTVPMTAIDSERLSKTIAVVHGLVPMGSRVFVGPRDMSQGVSGDNQLYHLMPEYNHRFYYNEFAPGVTERHGSPLMADVMSADALILTWLDPAAVAEALPNIAAGDAAVNEAVRTHFCLKAEVGVNQVWLRGSCTVSAT
jgi:hypothetical protein